MVEALQPSPNEAAERLAHRRGAHKLKLIGEGVEFLFFSAAIGTHYEGYRVPRARVYDTTNNPATPALGLQHKELELSAWALDHAVPSARPTDVVDQDGYPILITQIIEDDEVSLDQQALGALLAHMHKQKPTNDAVEKYSGTYRYLAQRISDRYARLSAEHPLPSLPEETILASLLERSLHRVSLLHLDIRRQNIRAMNGKPRALIDWSNALVAAPELELARIQEYSAIPENGLNFSEISDGYRFNSGAFDESTPAWSIARLDAALMLAGVFTSVSPREDLAELFLRRARAILLDL